MIRLALLLVLVLPLAVASEAGSAPGAPTPQCSPGPDTCSGWFTGNVTVSWTYDPAGVTQTAGCNVKTVTADGVSSQSCEVWYGDSSFARTVTVRRDATPPQIAGATPERGPDVEGWYNRAVTVVLSASDSTSGIASCDRPAYSGPDTSSAQVSGVCRDVAGNTSGAATVALKYDATPPSVTAGVDRPPDGADWYRRPLTVTFAGSDPVSGLGSCTAPARYAGPDSADVSLAGSCRDVAGNAAPEQRFAFRYDATAPRLRQVKARVAAGIARVGWQKPADAVLIRIDRIPGVNGAKRTQVYRGTGVRFLDRTVRKGIRYRYELSVVDAAGNVSGAAVATGRGQPLLSPARGAVVRRPVTLVWERASNARFYNVQLHRNGRKVLSAWPRSNRLRLTRSWRFGGKRQLFLPGSYTWYVWPGIGSVAKPRYGRLLGSSRFVVKR